jgi:hypothetical protein
VAGAAVVAGLMASTSQPAAKPGATVQTANPAVPSTPGQGGGTSSAS